MVSGIFCIKLTERSVSNIQSVIIIILIITVIIIRGRQLHCPAAVKGSFYPNNENKTCSLLLVVMVQSGLERSVSEVHSPPCLKDHTTVRTTVPTETVLQANVTLSSTNSSPICWCGDRDLNKGPCCAWTGALWWHDQHRSPTADAPLQRVNMWIWGFRFGLWSQHFVSRVGSQLLSRYPSVTELIPCVVSESWASQTVEINDLFFKLPDGSQNFF